VCSERERESVCVCVCGVMCVCSVVCVCVCMCGECVWCGVVWCVSYTRGAGKSLARPTSRCILFDGKNISFDARLIICGLLLSI